MTAIALCPARDDLNRFGDMLRRGSVLRRAGHLVVETETARQLLLTGSYSGWPASR